MKTSITKPLVQYVLVTTLLTILFRISLSELLNNQMWNLVFIPPVIYFILMYVSGRFFGIKEHEYLPIGDIGFRFHLSTFVVFFTVSYSMFYLEYMSSSEPRGIIDTTLLIWGILLFSHFIFYKKFKRNNIKGIKKEDIFEWFWFTNWFTPKVLKNKNPHSQGLRGFKGGPTWARTRDQLIMSQLL